MKNIACFLLSVFSVTSIFALDSTDDQKINQIIEHFAKAWNDQGGHGVADSYTKDADFVNIFGMVFSGKEEIETRHIKIHETLLKGSQFEVLEVRLREAKPDVVIAHVYWKVSHIQKQKEMPEFLKGIFTHVFLKNEEEWEITASHNTLTP